MRNTAVQILERQLADPTNSASRDLELQKSIADLENDKEFLIQIERQQSTGYDNVKQLFHQLGKNRGASA